jgi:hypothetical protein
MRYQRLILMSVIPWFLAGAAHADAPGDLSELQASPTTSLTPWEYSPHTIAARRSLRVPRIPSWLPDGVEVRKGAGLALSRPVRWGDTDLKLGVAGPVIRKRNLGMSIEVRF